MRGLATYLGKRDFTTTPEPQGGARPPGAAPHYSMQCHDATRLHYDLRLEWEGVLLSWAVTRGPSLDPAEKRLAVRTEDHPLDYLTFEGVIPEGYGAGTVMLWDVGAWTPTFDVQAGLDKGHLRMRLHGRRLTGEWHLVRLKGRAQDRGRENWLLIKQEDAAAHGPDPVERWTRSVATNRSLPQIAAGAAAQPFGPRRTAPAPAFLPPMLATLEAAPPSGPGWWHELKFDGYRGQVALGAGGAVLRMRSGQDWSDRFAPLMPAFAELPARTALIDGEVIAGADLGSFGALQQALPAGGPFRFYAFDLLHRDGRDLTGQPLTARRKALEALLKDVPPLGLIQLSPVVEGDAAAALATICAAGGEGIVSKRSAAPWQGGRSRDWIKVKCDRQAEFAVLGYQPSDKRGRAFASLLLGTREDGGWVYRGKVGTGFDGAAQAAMAARMAALKGPMPLARKPAGLGAVVWLRPELVASVRHAELTAAGQLRHASFAGWREDKPAEEVRMDTPASRPSGGRVPVAGARISSPDRIVFPPDGPTKLALARYYEAVAPKMLKVLKGRPLALLRLPDGVGGEAFFQKHVTKGWPAAVAPMAGEDAMLIGSAAGIVGAVQMGAVEFHVWGSRTDRLEQPDRLVFDLDPDAGVGWEEVRQAAADVRDLLAGIGLQTWAMVTGGKGVHVVAPLRRGPDWEIVKLFARTVATRLAETEPKRFVAQASKEKRRGRIFVDWLRNERGATAVAPFSVRGRPGARVAVPVSWEELAALPGADAFGLKEALARDWAEARVPRAAALEPAIRRADKAWT